MVLGVVALGLLAAFPFVLPAPHADASNLEKAQHLKWTVLYLLGLVLDLGAIAIIGARELKSVMDSYRNERRGAVEDLLTGLLSDKKQEKTNGKPLE